MHNMFPHFTNSNQAMTIPTYAIDKAAVNSLSGIKQHDLKGEIYDKNHNNLERIFLLFFSIQQVTPELAIF